MKFNEISSKDKFDKSRAFIPVLVNNVTVMFRADSGADITTIGQDVWKSIGSPKLTTFTAECFGVGGHTLNVAGIFPAQVQFEDKKLQEHVLVLYNEGVKLLGGRALEQLDILKWHPRVQINNITCNDFASKFPTVFETGLGKCTKEVVKLYLKTDAVPVRLNARPVALGVRDLVDSELDRLVDIGTLTSVDRSDWSTPIVVARKGNGQIRICADYSTGLNKALVDIDHPMPNTEDIMAKFAGNRVFTQLDLSDAYNQLPLDEESSKLTTIATHRGLYKYSRLVFGLKVAPAVFQKVIDQVICGIPGTLAYLDDILIMGSSKAEHDERVHKVLERLKEWGFRLRLEKCSFGLPKVKYLGMLVDEKGIEPDEKRFAALKSLRRPGNVKEMQSFLGLMNYYGKFVKSLHAFKNPLEDLTRKETEFVWSDKCESAFQDVKGILLGPLLLAHYDPQQTLIVAADASATGIGGVLLQRYEDGNEKAVFHMSKSLSPAQQNYSQIEKEAFALVTAVERFHKFIWGRKFILQTDHRPLLSLFRTTDTKGLNDRTAARLRRWALRLIGYDFQIEYVKTTDFGHADALSRLIEKAREDAADEELERVIASLEISNVELKNVAQEGFESVSQLYKLKECTKRDSVLQKVVHRVNDGWLEVDKHDPELKSFAIRADSFCVLDGVLLSQDRLVVPWVMRQSVLDQLHQAHPGIRRMKNLARLHFFWPGMNVDIEHMVRSCKHCCDVLPKPVKIPLKPWPRSEKPWERVHIDFGEPVKGKCFVAVVDSHSKYLDAQWLSNMTSKAVIDYLRVLFRHFGPPKTIVSDNGRQFISEEFSRFCTGFNITHLRSPPLMPQCNGQIERMVGTIKKSMDGDSDLEKAVMAYNYTPCAVLKEKTPAEVFFGREIRTPFDGLKPFGRGEEVNGSDLTYSQNMKLQFDKHNGAKVRPFKVGEMVILQLWNGQRVQGKITAFKGSCLIEIQIMGRTLIRHVNQVWRCAVSNTEEDVEFDADIADVHRTDLLPVCNDAVPSRTDPLPVCTDTSSSNGAASQTIRNPLPDTGHNNCSGASPTPRCARQLMSPRRLRSGRMLP